MLLPPRNDSFSAAGVGALVEMALKKLDWLPTRWSLGAEEYSSDGRSIETIERRPETSDTRCWDERRRGLGIDAERCRGVRDLPASPEKFEEILSGVIAPMRGEDETGVCGNGVSVEIGSSVNALLRSASPFM